MTNSDIPFEDLHPVVRNEEDEIRKSIFGFALRKLHTLPFEEKKRWCDAISEWTTKKTKQARKPEIGRPNPTEMKTEGSEQACMAPDLGDEYHSSTEYLQRTGGQNQDTVQSLGNENTAAVLPLGEKRLRHAQKSAPDADPIHGGTVFQTVENSVATSSSPSTLASASLITSSEQANEFIGKYMRSLLDRVVGGSLADLSAGALRVLCIMVGIQTTSKSKDVLYNILASFHYTNCERLGKRVSKDPFLQKDFRQTAEMLSKLAQKKSAPAKGATLPAHAPTPSGSTKGKCSSNASRDVVALEASSQPKAGRSSYDSGLRAEPPLRSNNRSTLSTSTVSGHAGPQIAPRSSNHHLYDLPDQTKGPMYSFNNRAVDHKPIPNDGSEDDALHIEYPSPVFVNTANSVLSSSNGVNSYCVSRGSEAGSWSTAQLESRIASIVQLCDPVTVTIVVAKLAQMGYREANAAETVEAVLCRFHQKQFIFYDNGIAYML